MSPDSNREWFIYFKEKEMGPLPESQVKLRFTQGELDGTAFVFTEGMSDWVSIDEVEVFVEPSDEGAEQQEQTISPESTVEVPTQTFTPPSPPEELFEQQDLSAPEGTVEGVEEQQFAESAGELPPIEQELQGSGLQVEKLGAPKAEPDFLSEKAEAKTAAGSEAQQPKKVKYARLALLFFTALLTGAILFDLANVSSGGQPAFVRALLGNISEFTGSGTAATDSEVSGEAGLAEQPVVANNPSKDEIVWSELQALRNSDDRSVAPFRISSQLLSGKRPIIAGAVSSFIDVETVHLLVMPDMPRNTMAHPEFWWFSLPLVDGYFAAGPLNIAGQELPDGKYLVWAQAGGNFLGEASFDLGVLPRGPEADVIAKQLQNEWQMRAAEERGFLEDRVSDLSQLYELLRKDSIALAIKGAAKRKEWDASSKAWGEAFESAQLQLSAASLASYYPEFQGVIQKFSDEMLEVRDLMDVYNKSGRAAFERRAGTRFTPLWNGLKNQRDALVSEASSLEGLKVGQVVVDKDAAKAILLGLE